MKGHGTPERHGAGAIPARITRIPEGEVAQLISLVEDHGLEGAIKYLDPSIPRPWNPERNHDMVNRHFKILVFALALLTGCDNTTKSDISVKPDESNSKYWIVKADIKIEAKDRADAVARVIPMFEAFSKSSEKPPIPAEKPPENKQ